MSYLFRLLAFRPSRVVHDHRAALGHMRPSARKEQAKRRSGPR